VRWQAARDTASDGCWIHKLKWTALTNQRFATGNSSDSRDKIYHWYLPVLAQKWLMPSNAYYLTAIYTCAQVRRDTQSGAGGTIEVWDASLSVIAFSTSSEQAQRLIENALREQSSDDIKKEITIRKFYEAPIIGQLLTETGNAPLNWPQILETSDSLLQSAPLDDFEQGYWVDVDQTVRPDKLSFSLGTLQSDVPEDVRSGLNWSGEKQFFFRLSVLPLPSPQIPAYEVQVDDLETVDSKEPSPAELDEMNVILPEAVAIIQARNSVAAAWLWRRYAANTQWNHHAIRITPMCGTVGEPEA
jgi:hypothetical protein